MTGRTTRGGGRRFPSRWRWWSERRTRPLRPTKSTRRSCRSSGTGIPDVVVPDGQDRGNCGGRTGDYGEKLLNCSMPVDQLPLNARGEAWLKYVDILQSPTTVECCAARAAGLADRWRLHFRVSGPRRHAASDQQLRVAHGVDERRRSHAADRDSCFNTDSRSGASMATTS